MLNHIVIMGRLVRDPELKQTNSGVSVCSFDIACERDFKQGDEKVSDFVRVTVWRKTAEFVCNYFSKGSMVVVDGRLENEKYKDKDGNERTTNKITADHIYFGDSKRRDGNASQNNAQNYASPVDGMFAEEGSGEVLPF